MFSDNSIRVDRSALYEQVWAEPMIKVAKQYSISDVAFAKICRKLNIPVPGRGYWRRKETGKQVPPRPSLPPLPADVPTVATIRGSIPKPTNEAVNEAVLEAIQNQVEYEAGHPVEVPARISRLHPLLTGLPDALKAASADNYGALSSREANRFNLRVSRHSASRAIRILHIFITAALERGFAPAAGTDQKAFCVMVLGESLEIALEERFKQLPPDLARRSRESWYSPRYVYEPTGQLTLRIKTVWGNGVRKVWRDTKDIKLEELLNDVMVGLVKVSEAQRLAILERDRQHQEWEEEYRRRDLEARRRQEELARRQALEAEAAQWAKAGEIRGYVAALQTVAVQKGVVATGDDRLERWLTWATEHAERLDPVPRLLAILTQPPTKYPETA